MENSIKIEVSKISNGWLSETETEGVTYIPNSEIIIDELRNNLSKVDFDSIPNGSKVAFEFIVHNLNEEPTIKELYDQVVIKEVPYNPIKEIEVDESKLRISITANNCMSVVDLKKIDWKEFIETSGLTYKRMSEITGNSESSVYQMFYSIGKGTNTFVTSSRIRLTTLLKFIEMKKGAKATLNEEIKDLKEALAEEVDKLFALKDIQGTYLRMKNARPILDKIKDLVS